MQSSPVARLSKSLGRETLGERSRRAARELKVQDVRESLAQEREARRSISYLPGPRPRYDDDPRLARYTNDPLPRIVNPVQAPFTERTRRYIIEDDTYLNPYFSRPQRRFEEERIIDSERFARGMDQAETTRKRQSEFAVPAQQRLRRSNSDTIIGSRSRAKSYERLRPPRDEEFIHQLGPIRAQSNRTRDYFFEDVPVVYSRSRSRSLSRNIDIAPPPPEPILESDFESDENDESYNNLVSLGILKPKARRAPPNMPSVIPESSYRRAYSTRPLSPINASLESRTRRVDAYAAPVPVNRDDVFMRRDPDETDVYVDRSHTNRGYVERELEREIDPELGVVPRREPRRERDRDRDREVELMRERLQDEEREREREREWEKELVRERMRKIELEREKIREEEQRLRARRENFAAERLGTRLVTERTDRQPEFLRPRQRSTESVSERDRERPVLRSWPAACNAIHVFDIDEKPLMVDQALWVSSLSHNWISRRLVEKLDLHRLIAATNVESWNIFGFRHEYDSPDSPVRSPSRLTRVQVGWRFLDANPGLKRDFFRIAPLDKLDIIFGGPSLRQYIGSEPEEELMIEILEIEQRRLQYFHPAFTDILYFSKLDKQWVLDAFRRASIKRGKQPDTQVHESTGSMSSLSRESIHHNQHSFGSGSIDESDAKSSSERFTQTQALMLYHPPLTREDFIPDPSTPISSDTNSLPSSEKTSSITPSIRVSVTSDRNSSDIDPSRRTSNGDSDSSSTRTFGNGYEASAEFSEESDFSSKSGYEASDEKSSSSSTL